MNLRTRWLTFSYTTLFVAAIAVSMPACKAVNLTGLTPNASNLVYQGTPTDLVFDENATIYDGLTVTSTIAALNGDAGGWTMNATFTPTTTDLETGRTSLVMEIGGTANSTALWLVDGVPTLSLRRGGNVTAPASFAINDTNLSDTAAAIYSAFGKLLPDNEYSIAASWDTGNQFSLAVRNNTTNTGLLQTANIYGAAGHNWSGDDSLQFGTIFNGEGEGIPGKWGGLNSAPYDPLTASPNPLHVDRAESMQGSFDGSSTFFLNASAFTGVGGATSLNLAGATSLPIVTATIDMDSSTISLHNPTASPIAIDAYTLAAGQGGFDSGDGPVGEVTADGGGTALFTIPANSSAIVPGVAWVDSPFTDAGALVTYNGNAVNVPVNYVGTPSPFGDLDGNGMVDAGDYPILYSNLVSNVSAMNGLARYLAGDLLPNGVVDRNDFREFKRLYEAANGIGSFDAMLGGSQVPEPSSMAIVGVVLGALVLRKKAMRQLLTVAALLFAVGVPATAPAADIYMVSNTGEIRSFAGMDGNPDSVVQKGTFANGNLVATVASYGGYQGFTSLPNGSVYGVNINGGVDVWPTLSDWTSNTNMTTVSTGNPFGPLSTVSPKSGVHDISFDGATGGLYAVLEGPDANDGHLKQFSTLKNFLQNTGTITAGAYPGNIMVMYYPDEDTPATAGLPNAAAAPGSNYLHITGGGQMEGWSGTLLQAGFGMYGPAATPGGPGGPANRSFQLAGFGSQVVGGFAVVEDTQEMSLLVDTTTGVVVLQRPAADRTIDRLRVQSVGGGLTNEGYLGLSSLPEFPHGGGLGTGWDRAPSNEIDQNNKHEFFGFGSSTIEAAGPVIPLGLFYDTTEDLRDLTLWYDDVSGGVTNVREFSIGGVYTDYVQTPGLPGDYNGDNAVNLADYTVWRDNLGGADGSLQNRSAVLAGTAVGNIDYLVWKANFGKVAVGGIAASPQSVPEPASVIGMGLVASVLGFLHRRRARCCS